MNYQRGCLRIKNKTPRVDPHITKEEVMAVAEAVKALAYARIFDILLSSISHLFACINLQVRNLDKFRNMKPSGMLIKSAFTE